MSHFWNNNPELLDEITITNLPEPYKTWCELGEKPYPWWRFTYRWPMYKASRSLEKIFPSLKTRYESVGKRTRYMPGLSKKWYPYGTEYYVNDVPEDIMFKAMSEGEADYWATQIDAVKTRRKYEKD